MTHSTFKQCFENGQVLRNCTLYARGGQSSKWAERSRSMQFDLVCQLSGICERVQHVGGNSLKIGEASAHDQTMARFVDLYFEFLLHGFGQRAKLSVYAPYPDRTRRDLASLLDGIVPSRQVLKIGEVFKDSNGGSVNDDTIGKLHKSGFLFPGDYSYPLNKFIADLQPFPPFPRTPLPPPHSL